MKTSKFVKFAKQFIVVDEIQKIKYIGKTNTFTKTANKFKLTSSGQYLLLQGELKPIDLKDLYKQHKLIKMIGKAMFKHGLFHERSGCQLDSTEVASTVINEFLNNERLKIIERCAL